MWIGVYSLPTDVAETIYTVGAQDNNGWHYLLEKYALSISAAEKSKILSALTSNKDPNKLLRYIIIYTIALCLI